MMLLLYLDQHIARDITIGLRSRGVDVLTAFEDGYSSAEDEQLLIRATQLGRVIYTNDHDFLTIGHLAQEKQLSFSGIIFGHQMRITIGQAIHDLELITKTLEPEEILNQIMYLPI